MAIGKSLRFKVFARDLFTCQYCGQQTPAVTLEVDHIHPSSKGGSDDEINLITSCFDCNRGKRDKIITDIAPRPDANLKALKAKQEIAEAKLFLEAQRELNDVRQQVCVSLQWHWAKLLTGETVPADKVILTWLSTYGADEVMASIQCAVPFYMRSAQYKHDGGFNALLKYVGAILRNRKNEVPNG